MRSQIFAGLALAAVAAAAPMESRASDEQVTINNAVFVRQDGNANDNWDTITSVSLSLTTPSGSVNCNASSFPDPSVPSNVYPCADSTYSFQISSRPGYDLYAITVTHKVSDRYANPLFSLRRYTNCNKRHFNRHCQRWLQRPYPYVLLSGWL